jgi:hypothetical protein
MVVNVLPDVFEDAAVAGDPLLHVVVALPLHGRPQLTLVDGLLYERPGPMLQSILHL